MAPSLSELSSEREHSVVRSASELRVVSLHFQTRLKQAVLRRGAFAALRTAWVTENAAVSIENFPLV